LVLVFWPHVAAAQAERRQRRRGWWLASTWEGMVALDGLVDPEAGQSLVAALEPLARPAGASDERSGSQRRADALVEWGPAQPGGRPAAPERWGAAPAGRDHGHHDGHGDHDHGRGGDGGLADRLRAAAVMLPPVLGGAPAQPLEVGRTARVVAAAQRAALAVRDGGCAFPGCSRPPTWCEAHHLRHWLHGGRTDLANLALLCRAHHRAVHEGGWRLRRLADSRLAATHPVENTVPRREPALVSSPGPAVRVRGRAAARPARRGPRT
jgi:hypothetical protein